MIHRAVRWLAPVWVTLAILLTGFLVAVILNWFGGRPHP